MRTIEKGPAPGCLAGAAAHGATHDYDWKDLPGDCKEQVRQDLFTAQAGLCAYCCSRIGPVAFRREVAPAGMKIEHVLPRSGPDKDRMFEWDNLLGVCGGEQLWQGRWVQTCDTARGNRPLTIHPGTPSPPRPEAVFAFHRWPPEGGEPPFPGVWIHGLTWEAREAIDTLNLNAEHLVRRRRSAQKALGTQLQRSRRTNAVLRGAWRRCTTPDEQGRLAEFAPMLRAYLQPKLAQRGLLP